MLYSKSQLAARHAASTDPTRFNLNGVHFKADGSTEASDGHMLIQVSPLGTDPQAFPASAGINYTEGETLVPFILPSATVNQLAKSIPKAGKGFPILANAALDVASTNANGAARFVVTDLETSGEVKGEKIAGEFPNTSQVIPERGEVTFAMNLEFLEKVIKAAKEFAPKSKCRVAKFYATDTLSPVRIELDDAEHGEMLAVVMPVRVK